MTIPSGVRGVSWTGEHNGDRVRHRSSGFHRRDFLFGALATVATRVNLRVVNEAYPFRSARFFLSDRFVGLPARRHARLLPARRHRKRPRPELVRLRNAATPTW